MEADHGLVCLQLRVSRTKGGGGPGQPLLRHQGERCPAHTPCRFLASRAGTGELPAVSSPVCGHLLWLP